jgi:hypothetical protein
MKPVWSTPGLWPYYERMQLQDIELNWAGDRIQDDSLKKDAWWARWLLNRIGKHPKSWVPIARLQRDSLIYFGGAPSDAAFRAAAKAMGARVNRTHVGYDMIACDRLLWDLVKDVAI